MSAQRAFEDLKDMLARITGLSPLSHDAVLAGQINLYLFTDASNTGIGAWLGTGPSPDQAQPIAYDSRSLTSAERDYLVHENELCAIIHALKEWCPLLLGLPVHIMTDHATLKWFFQQPNLSERQKRWLKSSLTMTYTSPTYQGSPTSSLMHSLACTRMPPPSMNSP